MEALNETHTTTSERNDEAYGPFPSSSRKRFYVLTALSHLVPGLDVPEPVVPYPCWCPSSRYPGALVVPVVPEPWLPEPIVPVSLLVPVVPEPWLPEPIVPVSLLVPVVPEPWLPEPIVPVSLLVPVVPEPLLPDPELLLVLTALSREARRGRPPLFYSTY